MDHVWQGKLARGKDGGQIDADDAVPLIDSHIFQQADMRDAGIVYENVDAAEAGFALGEKLFHIGIVRYVADAGEYVHMTGFP